MASQRNPLLAPAVAHTHSDIDLMIMMGDLDVASLEEAPPPPPDHEHTDTDTDYDEHYEHPQHLRDTQDGSVSRTPSGGECSAPMIPLLDMSLSLAQKTRFDIPRSARNSRIFNHASIRFDSDDAEAEAMLSARREFVHSLPPPTGVVSPRTTHPPAARPTSHLMPTSLSMSFSSSPSVSPSVSPSPISSSASLSTSGNNERRLKIIEEVRTSERTYVEFLNSAILLFLVPLRKSLNNEHAASSAKMQSSTDSSSNATPLLSKSDIDVIFQNIEEILALHMTLLQRMAKLRDSVTAESQWVDVLLSAVREPEFIGSYQRYINGYDTAIARISYRIKPKSPGYSAAFDKFVKDKSDTELVNGQSLQSFLVTPIQRLPRYILLLRDLLKATALDHADRESIEEALKFLLHQTEQINKNKERHDAQARILDLYNRFSTKDAAHISDLLSHSIKLIAEGQIIEQVAGGPSPTTKERYLLLFNDVIIAASARRERLEFCWSARSCACSVRREEVDGVGVFTLTEQRKSATFPLSQEVRYTLMAMPEGTFVESFWQSAFEVLSKEIEPPAVLQRHAAYLKRLLAPSLIPEKDWILLSVGSRPIEFPSDSLLRAEGQQHDDLLYLSSGCASVEKALPDGSVVQIGEVVAGEFVGEMGFLKESNRVAAATVVARKGPITATPIRYQSITPTLLANPDLSRRFFHLVTLTLAQRLVDHPLATALQNRTMIMAKPVSNPHCGTPIRVPHAREATNRKHQAVLQKFKLPDEVIVQEYACTLKKKKMLGSLYIMQNHVCFHGKVFGKSTRILIPGNTISEVIKRDDNTLLVNHFRGDPHEFVFKTPEQAHEVFPVLANFLKDKNMVHRLQKYALTRRNSLSMTEADWDELLSFAEQHTYPKGHYVLKRGQLCNCIYSLSEGDCIVTNDTEQLGAIGRGEIFGEVSFTLGCAVTANVVVDSDEAVVLVFAREQLEGKLAENPALASGFFQYLARTLRIRVVRTEERVANTVAPS